MPHLGKVWKVSGEKKRGWLREEMPGAAAVVDEFREVFGHEAVTSWIARDVKAGTFWCEDYTNGKTFGTRPVSQAVVANVYRSPNGLPPMQEVERLLNGDVRYKNARMTMDQFIARFGKGGR